MSHMFEFLGITLPQSDLSILFKTGDKSIALFFIYYVSDFVNVVFGDRYSVCHRL